MPQYLRPEKVRWNFPVIGENWLEAIPSKSTHKLLQDLDAVLEKNHLTLSWSEANEDSYRGWLLFYEQIMGEQHHDIFATADFLEKKMVENKRVLLLNCSQVSGTRVGAGIITISPEQKWSFAFESTERVALKGGSGTSLGLLLALEYLRYAQFHDARQISFGRSRNGFGYYDTLGYLFSKLKIGYRSHPGESTEWSTEFPQKENEKTVWIAAEKPQSPLFFLTSHLLSEYPPELAHYVETLGIPVRQRV